MNPKGPKRHVVWTIPPNNVEYIHVAWKHIQNICKTNHIREKKVLLLFPYTEILTFQGIYLKKGNTADKNIWMHGDGVPPLSTWFPVGSSV